MEKFDCKTCPHKKLSLPMLFAAVFVISAAAFGIGFIASYHHYQGSPAKTTTSGSGYYSSKTYTLGLSDEMPFGKHKGKSVQEVLDEEPDYLRWMLREVQRVTFGAEVLELLEH